MARALILVLDSVGIGGAPDAAAYGDEGANTLLHIAQACARGDGDRAGLRAGPLRLPHLDALGLGNAAEAATGVLPPGLTRGGAARGYAGSAIEKAQGKDTPSGHWAIAGAPASFAWGYFPQTIPAFPDWLVQGLIEEGGVGGILGNRHGSGTDMMELFGEEHIRTGWPICYTSADSVFQIAAHETHFGLERLYEFCLVARKLCDRLKIGRVIARPFIGERAGEFQRTPRRRDHVIPPPAGSILQRASEGGRDIVTIGKIADIFGHRHTGREMKGANNMQHVDMLLRALPDLAEGGFLFANFVDFDTEYGHRRDVPGYAACLEAFDARMPEIVALLRPGDLVILTADHGNDPTWRGTDHTREQAPVLAFGPGIAPCDLGQLASFADMGASAAEHLGLPPTLAGASFLTRN